MGWEVESLGRLEDGVEWYWLGQYLTGKKPPFFCMCPGGFMRSRSGNDWRAKNGYSIVNPVEDDATYPLTSLDRFVSVSGRDPFYLTPATLVMFFNIGNRYELNLARRAMEVGKKIGKDCKLIDLID